MSVYLGIDIGGTKIAAGLVSDDGGLSGTVVRPTEAQRGGAHVLAAAVAIAHEAIDGRSIDGIGIGAGGQIDPIGGIVVSATDILPGWAGVRIAGAFARFDVPVAVDNDVNALAMGEVRFGAARGARTAALVALGTGVGGALVIEGRLHHGAHFAAAEFGHIIVDSAPGARCDPGGARGTLEAYCSGAGLARTWRELTATDGTMDVRVDARAIADEALRHPDGAAMAALVRTGEMLGIGLATLANALDPDIFIIGGGLAQIGESLLGPARAALREHALPGPAQCPVVAAALGEHAAVIGAASLSMPWRV